MKCEGGYRKKYGEPSSEPKIKELRASIEVLQRYSFFSNVQNLFTKRKEIITKRLALRVFFVVLIGQRCIEAKTAGRLNSDYRHFTKDSGKQTFSRPIAPANNGAISVSSNPAMPQPMRVT